MNHLQIAVRIALASLFIFTGIAHFNRVRPDLVRMVPPGFPNPEALVTISGIAEIAGAIGLLIPSVSKLSACGLILLLIAIFPANIYAARQKLSIAGMPHPSLGIRLAMQLLLIGLLVWGATPH